MDRYSTTAVISNKHGNNNNNNSNAILSPTDSQQQQSDMKSCRKCVSSYYENYQRMRMESRQKRVQQAMELEDTPEGSVSYILGKIRLLLSSSWCDLTDFKGVFVVSLVACGFILMFYILEEKEYESTSTVAVTGIIMLIIRCLWWPIYWCCWGERALRVSFFSTLPLLPFLRLTSYLH
jgi:predicted RND superfamily exporter protein